MVEVLLEVMEENFPVVMGQMLLMVLVVVEVAVVHRQKAVLHIMEEMVARVLLS
jgi:hypothetical protein